MKITADTLIRGTAALDRMESELTRVIKLLFWLTRNNPKLWIRKHMLTSNYGWDFKTQFGTLEPSKAVWEVWYAIGTKSGGFRARCVYLKDADSKPIEVYSTAHQDDTVSPLSPGSDSKLISPLIKCGDPIAGAGALLIARDHLDIFVEGMLSEFPLGVLTAPYVEAASRG
jgi:hypothetical protein